MFNDFGGTNLFDAIISDEIPAGEELVVVLKAKSAGASYIGTIVNSNTQFTLLIIIFSSVSLCLIFYICMFVIILSRYRTYKRHRIEEEEEQLFKVREI